MGPRRAAAFLSLTPFPASTGLLPPLRSRYEMGVVRWEMQWVGAAALSLALVLILLGYWGGGLGMAQAALSALPDLDLTSSTDFEDLSAVAGDMMEFAEQDRLLLSDGGLEVGLAGGAPAFLHGLR